jgi:hypothetical protein
MVRLLVLFLITLVFAADAIPYITNHMKKSTVFLLPVWLGIYQGTLKDL